MRKLSDRMEELMNKEGDPKLLAERRAMISKHMELQSKRASLLMRSMVSLYIASGMFVLTSVTIGFVSIFSAQWSVIPVILGVGGAMMLLVAAIRLITEARMALDGLHEETEFLQRITAVHSEGSGKRD